ncbi:helix-turn-helix domain-containing protein [uncultured Paracoccus sp.]|uniref:helix-turn-helix domain-containing protein n=1 Tax=uncultured Paracoccus sp. TaxID=189685 RepID=UPI00262ECDDC|nr:helix-turn-helix domain-containing protein [uncultured Paracoccus sp.]
MIGLRTDRPASDDSTRVPSAPRFDDFEMRLGDVMRGERATLGKSLLDVQRELRIKASQVAAIENCDVLAFDAPSFISGYVRSYARYLGMDPDWTFYRFCEESGFQPIHGMAPAASGPRPQRRPSDPVEALANPHALFIPQPESFWSGVEPRALGSVAVMIAIVAGLGYGGWAVLQEVQKVRLTPSEQAPAVVAALDPVQEVQTPDAGRDVAVDLPQPDALDRIYRPQALEVPVMTPRDGPIAAIDPGLPEQVAAAPQNQQEPVIETVGLVPSSDLPVRTVAQDSPALELLAVRPAWVRVSSPDGTIVLEKTMDAGERFELPQLEQPALLRTGNSGSIYFAVNGQTYGPAAPGAQVVKNIELSPAALVDRFAAADLSTDPALAELVALASAAQLIGAAPIDGGTDVSVPRPPKPASSGTR